MRRAHLCESLLKLKTPSSRLHLRSRAYIRVDGALDQCFQHPHGVIRGNQQIATAHSSEAAVGRSLWGEYTVVTQPEYGESGSAWTKAMVRTCWTACTTIWVPR
jgi:hypothetical protein